MFWFSKKYLFVPINHDLGGCDLFLSRVMEDVAKSKGYKKGKHYLKKVLGCSSTSVKNMIRATPSSKSSNWNLDDYKTRDAYSYIRKFDIKKYAEAMNLLISEYMKIASNAQKQELIDYLNRYNANPLCYQKALCYKSIDGLNTAVSDSTTANRINRIDDADTIASEILESLLQKKDLIV